MTEWTDGTEDDEWDDPNHPWSPLPGVRTGSQLSRGERAADRMRNGMGSWGFVFFFLAGMAAWALVNSVFLGKDAWDPYPYILLNLFLSMLAGLQGAILLIAAKRADAIAAEQALSHLTISKASSEIIKTVNAELDSNTELTKDIHQIVVALHRLLKGEHHD